MRSDCPERSLIIFRFDDLADKHNEEEVAELQGLLATNDGRTMRFSDTLEEHWR
jgi:hypothetical protein